MLIALPHTCKDVARPFLEHSVLYYVARDQLRSLLNVCQVIAVVLLLRNTPRCPRAEISCSLGRHVHRLDQGCATCGPRATTRPAKPFSAALACSTARLNQVQICCWDNHRCGPKHKSRQPRTLLVRHFLWSRSKRFMFNIHEELVTLGLYSYRSTGD